jgi:hypothetical protein
MEFQSIIFKVNLRLRLKPLLVCSLLGLISPVKAADFNVQYDSRYVTEGRNNLQRGGIVWLSLDNEIIEHVSVNLVYGYATSSNVNYDELNLIFEYANTVGKVDWYVNYTSLHFFKDELTDNEIGLELATHYLNHSSALLIFSIVSKLLVFLQKLVFDLIIQ